MFIREVSHKDSKNNHEYRTYKLVEAVRQERGPRQRVLLNLGSDFNLPKEQWKDLANRIEDHICGQKSLIEYPKEVENLARRYAGKIINRQASVVVKKKGSEFECIPDYQTVDINSVENDQPRTVGAEHVVYHTMKELELDKKLKELGFNKPGIETTMGVITGKLVDPGSERATHIWLQEISGIGELLETDFSTLSQYQVYKVSDMLLKHKKDIEEHLSWKERNLFRLEERIILYDLTNTFFEGTGKYNKKARFGHSKDKRKDRPLVTMGLVLDGDGFPRRSNIFEGNVSEPTILDVMIKDLSGAASSCLMKPLVVLDAGVATKGNILWLKENGYTYIVVSRRKKKEAPAYINMVTVRENDYTVVRAGLISSKENDEIELYCHSTEKEKKEKSIKSLFQQRFEEELGKVQRALSQKNGTKRYEKVIERIGRLKEKYKRIAHRYGITIARDPETNKATAIKWQQKGGENTNGIYCLRTNRKDLNEQEIWNIYNMLTDIEESFRSMKSELGFRPVHHQKEFRVDGHLFITFLAYHVLHAIRFKLKLKGIHHSWETLRTFLSTQVRITTTMKRKDGKMIHIRKSSRAELFHQEIYDALDLPHQPGKMIRAIL